MSRPKNFRIALIKLAAIGDVAMAARALSEFLSTHSTSFEVHWFIDDQLVGLAKNLISLPPGNTVQWHPVNSSLLFRGSAFGKLQVTLKMCVELLRLQPQHTILLHRDKRYEFFFKPILKNSFQTIPREGDSELSIYRQAFVEFAKKFEIEKSNPSEKHPSSTPTGKIGVFIGGGSNQKGVYKEKRWPRFSEFIENYLKTGKSKIVLLGGPDDLAESERILSELKKKNLSLERLENQVAQHRIEQLPNILKNLDALISADSGMLHIAASVMNASHQKIIALFGPTDPKRWEPIASGNAKITILWKALRCSPCYTQDGKFNPCQFKGDEFQICMKSIEPNEVIQHLSD